MRSSCHTETPLLLYSFHISVVGLVRLKLLFQAIAVYIEKNSKYRCKHACSFIYRVSRMHKNIKALFRKRGPGRGKRDFHTLISLSP